MKSRLSHDPNDTEMTKRVMSISGFYIMTETMSGVVELELLRNEEDLFSLAFLDLKMSGMSGIETLRQIRVIFSFEYMIAIIP